MKRSLFATLIFGILASSAYADNQKPPTPGAPAPAAPVTAPVPAPKPEEKTDYSKIFKNDKEKNSYAIGMWASDNLKNQLKHDDIDFDLDALLKAIKDNLTGTDLKITEAQKQQILTELTKELRAKAGEKQKELADKNKKEGDAYLAANKTKPGIKSFDSGLQYEVLKEGTGDMPKPTDTVTVSYAGSLVDGTEFDKSPPGQPASFGVTGVIPGWTEALEHMKTGSKWKLFIPSNLAYGERGHGPKLPPNAALIFEVELISIKPAPSAAAPSATPPLASVNPGATPPLTSDIIKVPSAEELKKGAKIETIKAEDLEKEKAKTGN